MFILQYIFFLKSYCLFIHRNLWICRGTPQHSVLLVPWERTVCIASCTLHCTLVGKLVLITNKHIRLDYYIIATCVPETRPCTSPAHITPHCPCNTNDIFTVTGGGQNNGIF